MALLFKLPRNQVVTISIESGIQSGTLAITIATLPLNNPACTIVPLSYSLIMFASVALIIIFRQRSREQ